MMTLEEPMSFSSHSHFACLLKQGTNSLSTGWGMRLERLVALKPGPHHWHLLANIANKDS